MRILMWVSIGFAAACGLCVYVLPIKWLTAVSVIFGVVCVFFFATGFKWKKMRIAATLLFGTMLGTCWFSIYHHFYITPAIELNHAVFEAELIVTDDSIMSAYGSSVDASLKRDNLRYQVRIYFSEETDFHPGDILRGKFEFQFSGTKRAELSSNYQGKGIYLLAYPEEEPLCTHGEKLEWWLYPAMFTGEIKDILMACFPEDVFPFVKALLLGDSSELDYNTDSNLKISGIRHVVAVSGLHVSMLYSVIKILAGRKRFLTALIGIPVVTLFAAMAGFTPSVSRACIMIGLVMLAEVFQREYDSSTALGFSCLVMLVCNPMVIGSVSFQLSVGCVAGILIFYEPIKNAMGKRIRKKNFFFNWIVSSVSATLSAMTLTTPLSAWYFGTVSIVGILTNLVTLGAVTVVFVGIMLVCLFSFISIPIAAWLASILAYIIRYILVVAHILSRAPIAAVYTSSIYIVMWLVCCYILALVCCFVKKKNVSVFVCCVILLLILALALSWLDPFADECRVTVLDVGQGQSILYQSEGKTVLVDCGGSNPETAADAVMHQLLSQGIRHIDVVILTHSDYDHTGGLPYLLSRIDADAILLPATCGDYVFPETDAQIVWIDKVTKLSYGETSICVYPPEYVTNENENSLCILFTTKNCGILITGDRSAVGERMLIEKYALPDVDLLIAGHHGSSAATSNALLNVVQPETVIISVGANNRYGHGSESFVERLVSYGCAVYRTDRHGTIVYRR